MVTNMATTRERASCIVFSAPHKLPTNVIPTYSDVMKYYVDIRHILTEIKTKYRPSFRDVAEIVILDVEKVWCEASVPTVSHSRAVQILSTYHTKYRTVLKPYKARKDNANYIANLQSFRSDANILFDICSCKCEDAYKCARERNRKVALKDISFLLDQRSCRQMLIGGVDKAESNRLDKLQKRNIAEKESSSKRNRTGTLRDEKSDTNMNASDATNDDDDHGVEEANFNVPSTSRSTRTPNIDKQMRVQLPSLAKA